MQISPRRADLVWNYAGTLLGIGGNLLLLPALVYFLGSEELGLWYVFMSVASLAQLMQFGFGPTFARNISYGWSGASELSPIGLGFGAGSGQTNLLLMRQLIIVSKIVFGFISLVSQLFIATLGTIYIHRIAGELPRQEVTIAWVCFCLAIFLNMYFSYFDALLRGVGGIAELNKAIVIANMAKIVVTVSLLVSGVGLIGATIGYLAQALVYRVVCRLLLYRYQNLGESLRSTPYERTWHDILKLLRVVAPNAARDGLVSISNFMATTANTIICSIFLTLAETSVYSLTLQLVNAAANASVVFVATYHPALQSAFANRDQTRELMWTAKGLSSFWAVYGLAVVGLTVLVVPLLNSLRESFEVDLGFLLALSLYTFLWKQHSICASYIANTNSIPYVWAYLISSLASIGLSICLVSLIDLGLWGLVLGPLIVQGCYNNWKWPRATADRLGVSFFVLLGQGFRDWRRTASRVRWRRA